MAANPSPTHISPALWRFWEEFRAFEATAELGGIYAPKPGYHNYRDAVAVGDYSRRDLAADRRGDGGWASAIDLTLPDAQMRRYTSRLDVAARARDLRLYTSRGPVLREFIGTKDSSSVYCYVLAGGRALGVDADAGPDPGRDDSHLWHIHLSIIREFSGDWPALDGVLSVLKGETLTAWRARTEEDMFKDDDAARLRNVEGYLAALCGMRDASGLWNGTKTVTIPNVLAKTLTAIGAGVNIDPAELDAIRQAAREGATAAADDIVARVLAGLPDGVLTRDDVEAAVRDAFAGGLAA